MPATATRSTATSTPINSERRPFEAGVPAGRSVAGWLGSAPMGGSKPSAASSGDNACWPLWAPGVHGPAAPWASAAWPPSSAVNGASADGAGAGGPGGAGGASADGAGAGGEGGAGGASADGAAAAPVATAPAATAPVAAPLRQPLFFFFFSLGVPSTGTVEAPTTSARSHCASPVTGSMGGCQVTGRGGAAAPVAPGGGGGRAAST